MNLKQISKDPEYGKIDFMSKWPIFGGLSFLAVLASFVLFATKGFNYGIDFAGGTEVQVKFQAPVSAEKLRAFTSEIGFKSASVQSLGDDNEYLIRTEAKGSNANEINKQAEETAKAISTGLLSSFAEMKPEIRRVDTVGPQVGTELKRNGILAAFYSLIAILLYVALRFDYKFAPGAVICLFHDAIITLGVFSLLGKEVNVQTMAAILTIIGYSLNDTIINFDRVRENIPLYKKKPLALVINRSVNDVISRTVLTTFTTLLAVAAMYVLGGGVIRDLAFALGVGIIVGTYSTLYVASPLVLLFDRAESNPKA
jgi:preprotein translocase subunit SecF